MQARPFDDDARLIQNCLAPWATPYEHEDHQEQIRRPGQEGFIEGVFAQGQVTSGVTWHRITVARLPDFEQHDESDDGSQCSQNVGEFGTDEVGYEELDACKADAAHRRRRNYA